MLLPVVLHVLSSAWATSPSPDAFTGPDHTVVDILRTSPGGARIYVQARFPDGTAGLFLVDTGANISLLSTRTAERLGLSVDKDFGSVVGLGGVARMDRAVVPSLSFGDVTIDDVEMAVGVPGMTERAGAMELDGLLGNNIWSRFVLEVDYPADTLVLHRPGSIRLKRYATPMVFDGSHVFTPLEIRTTRTPDTRHSVVLRLDTGAGHLSLCGKVAEAFDTDWSEGLEPILGLGASETLPPFRNLQRTRQLHLEEVRLAGRKLKSIDRARWLNFDGSGSCPDGMRGLIGHHLLAEHRVLFDFQGGKLQLGPSRRKARSIDGHALVLEQERTRGTSALRALYRARLALQLDDLAGARADLMLAKRDPHDREAATVLLSQLDRYEGDLDASLAAVESLPAGALVDHDEIVATVNALLFEGRATDAVSLAKKAVEERPKAGWAHVALADALLANRDIEGAREAILEGVALESYPDAHLLRRARIALASGDRNASMAHIRKLLQLYPMGGEFLWFYALLVETDEDRVTFVGDLDRAMGRLHPERRPLDFLVAANEVVGDSARVAGALAEGLKRDCSGLDRGPARDNCLAWYWSLAGQRPDEALQRIQRAITSEGQRSDYLDTLAMVHLARREFGPAVEAAQAAARLAPDSVYMLWQAERIADLAAAADR